MENIMLQKSLKSLIVATLTSATVGIAAAGNTIVDVAASNPQFTTLVKAVKAAGLVDTLKSSGPFTVFAPTDAAFAKLPAGTLDKLIANPDQLRAVLTYHVVPAAVKAADVKPGAVKTANGQSFNVAMKSGTVMVDAAKVVATDVMASNGVIHVIDTVILPK
jgi:uncharacterized surface protein with fasciclin (FAS1) repeats